MKRYLHNFFLLAMFAVMLVTQASALEFSYDPPEDYLFGKPTSMDAAYVAENPNVDRSKNTALIPPGFGTPTSYLPGSGEHLTPNLVPGALSGGLVNQVSSINYPAVGASTQVPSTSINSNANGDSNFSYTTTQTTTQTTSFTDVTSDLYYSEGHLGTLKIPALGVNVKIFEGTDSAQLAKGAGHFQNTSIWAGNVCIAGHNRGTNCYFGNIHKLNAGDTITLTTQLGTRTYAVSSVSKVSETDTSGTDATSDNRITLYTCVRNESPYRWCVVAQEV